MCCTRKLSTWSMKGKTELSIARYVDDILVCSLRQHDGSGVKDFPIASCPELSNAVQAPLIGKIQFFDSHVMEWRPLLAILNVFSEISPASVQLPTKGCEKGATTRLCE